MPPHRLFPPPCPDKNIRHIIHHYIRNAVLGCLFQGLSQLFCDFVRVSGKPVLGMCVTGIGAVTNIILKAFVTGSAAD
nr:MATE family efflux transporter [uncultured Schaedlerella sp.]